MDEPLPDSLCPIYKEALIKMQDLLALAETNDKKTEILIKFSDEYLLPPKYWEMLINFNAKKHKFFSRASINLYYKCFSQFYLYLYFEGYGYEVLLNTIYGYPDYHIKRKLPYWRHNRYVLPTCYESDIKQLREFLKFPHRNLKLAFDRLQNYGPSPITREMKQKYEKLLKLYEKFVEAGEDDEKWLECMEEMEDEKLIIINIELRLSEGQHYANSKIWKFYINFMKSKNSADLLKIYDRYCRLFISDSQARRQYLVLKYAKFPFIFKDALKKWNIFSTPKWLKRKEPRKIYFKNCKKAKTQTLPFRSPLMHYITESAKASALHKLHKSCKYFFHQRPYPVCHLLILSDRAKYAKSFNYIEQSLIIKPNVFLASELQNLYISHQFSLDNYSKYNVKNIFQEHFSLKFYKCEANNIKILDAGINLKDFEFCINSGAVKHLKISGFSHIIKEDGKSMKKEEIKELIESYGNQMEQLNIE